MKLGFQLVLSLGLVCLLTGLAYGAEVTISTADGAGADTHVYWYETSTNYGESVGLRLSKNFIPYIKFDLSGLDGALASAAELSFYGTPSFEPNSLPVADFLDMPVYGLIDGTDDWGETTITYGNAPLVSNPIVAHPYLIPLGTLSYTVGDEGVITLTETGTALTDFLNNRGADDLVTIILGSEWATAGDFFSTKEDHGDGSEAPFIEVTHGGVGPAGTEWAGSQSNSWNLADNWVDEVSWPRLPDACDTVVLAGGVNYPVEVSSDAYAQKLFVTGGNLELVGGTLYLESDVLRIAEGRQVKLNGGDMRVRGDVRALVGAFADGGRLTASALGQEVYAETEADPNFTRVSTRTRVPYLRWGSGIVTADGPVGTSGDPAVNCVNASGVFGDYHARYEDHINSWYARGVPSDPTLKLTFDRVYMLGDMWVWNYEEGYNGYSLRAVRIEYSTDDVTYTTLMNDTETEFIFSIGHKNGMVSDIIPFAGAEARYVKLTAVGGTGVGNYQASGLPLGRYILRELRFYYQGAFHEALSYPSGGIIAATESHAAWGGIETYGATRVVDGSGMSGDIHSNGVTGTYWYARQPGETVEPWAQFDFDGLYYLDEMWVWNCDEALSESGRALQSVKVEYSALDSVSTSDPCDWTVLVDGSDPCDHWTKSVGGLRSDVVDFGNVLARHVKITPVGGYGVGNYGSTYGYLLNELRFYHNGLYEDLKASVPNPVNGGVVDIDVELSWTPGEGAVTGQDVWFGPASGTLTKIASNIAPDATSLDVGVLDNHVEYAWRVDGRAGTSVTTGTDWGFTTRAWLHWNPRGHGVAGALASAGDGGSTGDLAVNESGITGDLHAAFQWSNGWYCRKPWNVGITEPQLDIAFDRVYEITDMWVWNHDGTSYDESRMAMKTVGVEYSLDGSSYTTVMNGGDPYFVLPHGNTDGTHDTEISFGGVPAKYVRFTAVGGPGVGNYGSDDWGYKLRELRFYYEVPLYGDVDDDRRVDLVDFAMVAADWGTDNWVEEIGFCDPDPAGDVNGDCRVDVYDLGNLSVDWLDEY